jgi:hypothetical protein
MPTPRVDLEGLLQIMLHVGPKMNTITRMSPSDTVHMVRICTADGRHTERLRSGTVFFGSFSSGTVFFHFWCFHNIGFSMHGNEAAASSDPSENGVNHSDWWTQYP